MSTSDNMRVIAIEEHYLDEAVLARFPERDAKQPPPIKEALLEVGEARLKNMDEAGIDLQVLSHNAPAVQKLSDNQLAVKLATEANDRLGGIVKAKPDRLQAFAMLPTGDPKAATDELDRSVSELGFKGAMIHGLTNGEFNDLEKYWPIYERAAKLGVPIYMHPSLPDERVVDVYYRDYVADFPAILNAAWGFTVETATQGLRLVLSGVFDKYPDLKIVLGHLGEGLPFYLARIDEAMSRGAKREMSFREVFTSHFYITTSGFFSDPALLCCIQEMGTDRILFSVDYPYVRNDLGVEWMDRMQLNAGDKHKILHGNAEKLLGV